MKKLAASKPLTEKQQQARLNKVFNLGFVIDRQLLENCGYNTDEISDSKMEAIASQVGDYMDADYGSSVIAACDGNDIPKREKK